MSYGAAAGEGRIGGGSRGGALEAFAGAVVGGLSSMASLRRENGELRRLIAERPARHRARLSREFCERIGWRRPRRRPQGMAARVAMLAMHRDGWIVLPPPRRRRYPPRPDNPQLSQPPLGAPPATLHDAQPLNLAPMTARDRKASDYWNAGIAAHHYLGYAPQAGAQMRYTVFDRNGYPLALLGLRRRGLETGAPRPLHRLARLNPATPPQAHRQQHPTARAALGLPAQSPLLSVQTPRTPTPPRLARALRHHPRVDRNLRRNTPLYRNRLQGLRLDPCRRHPRPRPTGHPSTICPAKKAHLAKAATQKLATPTQRLIQHLRHGGRTLTIRGNFRLKSDKLCAVYGARACAMLFLNFVKWGSLNFLGKVSFDVVP